eukprot:TRINITY_DN9264_c0_g1_i2.p1 TRINITY_DN9264_c0_g1~~TRINITY_DN9264_c0_g1_i2.p1  ORF type:complete len:141 (-),score=20.71 TRINITY_DN9264_c0_g1_i2:71-493(-)
MQPTLSTSPEGWSDSVIWTSWGSVTNRQRGDVIWAKSPVDVGRALCKRIIALPGDVITLVTQKGREKKIVIPEGHMWLEGDNSESSRDSREYGPVPMNLYGGHCIARLRYARGLFRISSLTSKPPPSSDLSRKRISNVPN